MDGGKHVCGSVPPMDLRCTHACGLRFLVSFPSKAVGATESETSHGLSHMASLIPTCCLQQKMQRAVPVAGSVHGNVCPVFATNSQLQDLFFHLHQFQR